MFLTVSLRELTGKEHFQAGKLSALQNASVPTPKEKKSIEIILGNFALPLSHQDCAIALKHNYRKIILLLYDVL